jgi:hypothetical protein
MNDSTWILLQFVVAGCTGLLMWAVVLMVRNVWNRVCEIQRVMRAPDPRRHPDRSRDA